MIVKASGTSPLVKPKLYKTVSISSIMQAEQQDRFLQLGELNQLTSFFNSGSKRLDIANILAKNSNFIISKAADKIFIAGAPISYLEKPQASFLDTNLNINNESNVNINQDLLGDTSTNFIENIFAALFDTNDSLPPGFKPINVTRYGSVRMKKSLRDLDWFLRYLTYAIIAGDSNILSVNIRGLRELIDNACSSAAAIVALREMRKLSISLFKDDFDSKQLVQQYFDVVISEFESSSLSDKFRKRSSADLQGLKLPQVYSKAGVSTQKFVIKSSLSINEKNNVIKACYRQIFERDIVKAYNFQFTDLESQVRTGQLSIKEFIRCLGKSSIYRKQFYESFVNTRIVELAFKHFLGRGLGSLSEFKKYFSIISNQGLNGLIDSLLNSQEYADYFGEETVPYIRSLGEEAQESRNWGPQIKLFNYSAVFRKKPEFLTLFSDYKSNLPDQHPYGLGNDPLSIQFGAIFPKNLVALNTKSSFFTRDTRRILLRYGPGIYNQISNPNYRNKQIGSLGPVVFSTNNPKMNIDQVVAAIYIRIFGRFLYQDELSSIIKFESIFRSNSISIREFIRLLVKSLLFRNLYWNSLYICKAIEYMHIKLIGRPTYGRQEINKYFDIVYKQDYYTMVNSMLDSVEYIEAFGENTVPYERYRTSVSMLSKNSLLKLSLNKSLNSLSNNRYRDNFSVDLKGSINSVNLKINQGVTSRRYQTKIFSLDSNTNLSEKSKILRAIYHQLFERELNSFSIGDEFYNLEKAFMLGKLNVQQLIEKIGYSALYRKEFYNPYPNIKVIELGTKHFLGRAPNNQAEIRYYNQILASQGIFYFVNVLVNSLEYNTVFGCNIVPYRRFPTLPAANFPNTEKLYNTLTKQNSVVIVPSFK
uniref:Phycobiliprotein ApcE n=1 Tax=Cliftonaea pectinata TaxID=2007206 RepID=A0A1Z1MQC3_9FLOR|nr:phycobilisome linker polypeptide [Cliftonaea pectinata]ARW67985.1 phycobilisome linker polypeptide [Cliftonaea pectinata]